MKIRKAIFLSHLISQRTPLYAGEGKIVLSQVKSLKNGDSCNKMQYSFPNHSGTHVDAPLHSLGNSLSVTDFVAEKWIMQKISILRVKGIIAGYIIKPRDLGQVRDCQLLIIKTDFEKFRNRRCYWANSPCISHETCLWLKNKCPSLRAVGFDFISVSNIKNKELGRLAHKEFLGNNILLIEDMKLSGLLLKKPDFVIVAPLMVKNADASPCTVIAAYS